jgi:hypothetical protein
VGYEPDVNLSGIFSATTSGFGPTTVGRAREGVFVHALFSTTSGIRWQRGAGAVLSVGKALPATET